MKISVAVIALLAWTALSSNAAEITLIAPGGIRAALEELIPGFERASGHRVKATFGSGGGRKERIVNGEPFDVPVAQPPLDPVIASGHVVPASETPLASVALGLAVRAGSPKPDLSTADAVKRLVFTAKAISYPNPASGAAAGVSLNETVRKLGIAEEMKSKLKLAQGGRGAMQMLANGEVDYGITFISEIITESGVEVAGALPADISTPTSLVGFLSAHTKEREAAQALLRYLSSPDAHAVYRVKGMRPGR